MEAGVASGTAVVQPPKKEEKSVEQQVVKQVSVFEPAAMPCCRMCLEEDQSANMVQPCECKGSQQWAHEQCLVVWQEWQMDKQQDFVCAVCGAERVKIIWRKG